MEDIKRIVTIENCSEDKNYFTAYVHKEGTWIMSFRITVTPNYLFYYGDIGNFTIHYDDPKILNNFIDQLYSSYTYWERYTNSTEIREFNSEILIRNLLFDMCQEFDISEKLFSKEDIENHNILKLEQILMDLPEKYYDDYSFSYKNYTEYESNKQLVINCFNNMIAHSEYENDLQEFYNSYYYIFESSSICSTVYTQRYKYFIDNLHKYAKEILDALDTYLKDGNK